MAKESQPPVVTVHQCLFGYDDGHRLLASSAKLSSEIHSSLLPLSDLVPGIKLSDVGSYWTGVPLREAKQYALMRTWPAPEMPRPGCVWTHVILVSFADVVRFGALGSLRNLTIRPNYPCNYSEYKTAIRLNPEILSKAYNDRGQIVNPDQALKLIRVLYSSNESIIEAKLGEFDDALFALWSQQWPRLRRSFSFRTAASKLEGNYPSVRFDLRLIASEENSLIATSEISRYKKSWEAIAVEDICNIHPTDFRRFLWRYGSDLENGLDRYQILADIYIKTCKDSLKGHNLDAVLEMVVNEIPAPNDGLTLKEDIISCGLSKFSLLPPSDTIDMLGFVISHPEVDALPTPPIEICATIKESYPTRSSDIFLLAGLAAEQNSKLVDEILKNVAAVVESKNFLSLSKNKPNLRERMILLNPTLLISEELVEVPQPELSRLLNIIPDGNSGIASGLLNYLLRLDDENIAEEMMQRFPRETLRATVEFLCRSIEENGVTLPFYWRRELERNGSALLNEGFVESARSTRFLSELAVLLRYDSIDVMKFGSRPWITALKAAKDDISGCKRQTFLAFLLAMAIRYPVTGSELLFELAFEAVHNDIWYARFTSEGMSILGRHLPDIGWRNWDTCKRIRIAVVSAYVEGDLDPKSFIRLMPQKLLMGNLTDLAEETKKGFLFLNKISA